MKPPSVRGVEVAKASAAAKGSGYSDQVVAKARVWVCLFLFPLGLATTTAAILLYKREKSNFEVSKPKVAIYVLTGVRQGGWDC